MGFAWAVHIAHEVATSLINRAQAATRIILAGTVRFCSLSQSMRHLQITARSILTLHIIDDVNAVCFDMEDHELNIFQRCIWTLFFRNGLPLKPSKSTPLGSILKETVPFIGFEWNMKTHVIAPKQKRIQSVSALVHQDNLHFQALSEELYRKLLGKLIWFCLARRPLLSVLRCAVDPAALTDERLRALAASEFRRIATISPLARVTAFSPSMRHHGEQQSPERLHIQKTSTTC